MIESHARSVWAASACQSPTRPPARARGTRNERDGGPTAAATDRREAPRAPRALEVPQRGRHRCRALVRLAEVVGIVDLGRRARAAGRSKSPPLAISPLFEGRLVRAPSANERSSALSSVSASVPASSSRSSEADAGSMLTSASVARTRASLCGRRERERVPRPSVDPLAVQPDREHRRPNGRLEGEERVDVGSLSVVERPSSARLSDVSMPSAS